MHDKQKDTCLEVEDEVTYLNGAVQFCFVLSMIDDGKQLSLFCSRFIIGSGDLMAVCRLGVDGVVGDEAFTEAFIEEAKVLV